jgi:hypothetical protein
MSSSVWSLLELAGFFVMALGLGLHQLWGLKKLELQRRKREAQTSEASSGT